jgi:hypothetical protein
MLRSAFEVAWALVATAALVVVCGLLVLIDGDAQSDLAYLRSLSGDQRRFGR